MGTNHENGLQNDIENRILMSNCQALKFSKFQHTSLMAFPISSDESEIKERARLSSSGGLKSGFDKSSKPADSYHV